MLGIKMEGNLSITLLIMLWTDGEITCLFWVTDEICKGLWGLQLKHQTYEKIPLTHADSRASGDLSYLGWGSRLVHRWRSLCKAAEKRETQGNQQMRWQIAGLKSSAQLGLCKLKSWLSGAWHIANICISKAVSNRSNSLTVATINWMLPNSCIPLPNLIFRYCDRQTAGVIKHHSISAHIPHLSSPLIFTSFDDPQVHFNILSGNPGPISSL